MKNYIDQFMWGYQSHFRAALRMRADAVLERISAGEKAEAFLVGVLRPGCTQRYAVCVEPEGGALPQPLFDGLLEEIEPAIEADERQNMFFGDEPSRRDMPENIRRSVTHAKILERIRRYDGERATQSFCGAVYPVGDYYVCPVIQLPQRLLERFPPVLFDQVTDWTPTRLSLVESCLHSLLVEASNALIFPEAGRIFSEPMRSAEEIVARAAASFMNGIVALVGPYGEVDLFRALNEISALKYEGASASGRIILTPQTSARRERDLLLRLSQPVRLSQARWVRKLLQLANAPGALLGDAAALRAVVLESGQPIGPRDPTFNVSFPADRQWTLSHGAQVLLQVEAGEARLPAESLRRTQFDTQMRQMFAGVADLDVDALWRIFQLTLTLGRGHMVVVAADAAEEAVRLANQGMAIEPVPLTLELLQRAGQIDGTVLVDVGGRCQAIGVILDGIAQETCTPSRGARFNSAVRYVAGGDRPRIAFVVSEDATLDIIPLLPPQIEAALLEEALAALEVATLETYHRPRSSLDQHRFYLSDEQCRRANAAIARLDAVPREVGEIYISTSPFAPHPAMHPSYLI